jgi:hypothetical protein
MKIIADRSRDFAALSTETILRNGLIGLACLSTAATLTELLLLRHFGSALALIPWAASVLLIIAIALVVAETSRSIRAARGVGVIVLGIAAIGVGVHVWSNYKAGPLDAEYMYTWATLGFPVRLFLAATGTVGPSPALAPMALAFSSLCLMLSTVRHAALDRRPRIEATLTPRPQGIAKLAPAHDVVVQYREVPSATRIVPLRERLHHIDLEARSENSSHAQQ